MQTEKQVDIAIVGSGLTALTLAFYLKKAGKTVAIIEKSDKTGGVIQTYTEEGFTYEAGPNTGVLSSPELVQLFDDLGERCTVEVANSNAKRRLIWKRDKWEPLPYSLTSAINTPLFTFKDKLRILGEPFRKRGTNPYETLDKMVLRRLGKSFLEYAVDPFISGIYAGDPTKLIPKFALPKLYNLEQNYGSFIRGSIKKAKMPKTELEKRATKEVFSVSGGLSNLTNTLTAMVGIENIYLNATARALKTDDGFDLKLAFVNGDFIIHSKKLVSTVGAYELSNLLSFISEEDLKPITNLTYAKVAQVVVGYKKWQGIPLTGFGGLIPSKENRKVLGILFPSAIFANRAPKDGALLSIFLGGIKHEDIFNQSDENLIDTAINEAITTLGASATPDMVRLFRYPHAIAQYEQSSEQRFEQIERLEKEHSGLILAGNIRNGIGMSDRVVQAVKIAKEIM